jgi:hypothetical protein
MKHCMRCGVELNWCAEIGRNGWYVLCIVCHEEGEE